MLLDILIVGVAHGGVQAATVFRHAKFDCSIGSVREEFEILYERSTLGKDYLAQNALFERRPFNELFATVDEYEGISTSTEKRHGVWKGKRASPCQ